MRALPFSAVFLLLGCATAAPAGTRDINFDPIGREELLSAGGRNVEQAVRRLRPRWELKQPPQSRIEVIKDGAQGWVCYTDQPTLLYVDGRKYGSRPTGLSDLSRILVEDVLEVHYIQPMGRRPDGEMRCGWLPAIHVIKRGSP